MAEINSETIQAVKNQFHLMGNSAGLTDAIVRSMQVAPYDISVLVTGESGTGKETIPKIIHNLGPRKHQQYIAINCGAIPEGTIDSELFGHMKGAFTDAINDHKGYFEVANGGTIFLDEVAEMPLPTQARLLRVLENGEFLRMGSSEVRKTNVRVIAATNKNLLQMSKEGKFREDLYYRLSAVQITLPALRERGRDDIVMLARYFAHKFAEANRCPMVKFAPDAQAMLAAQEWPGNVRQLKNIIDQISLFHAGTSVDASVVREYMPHSRSEFLPATADSNRYSYDNERAAIFEAIRALSDEVKRLSQLVGEHTTSAPAYVNTSVASLRRELSPAISHASIDTGDTVIEHVVDDAQPTYHHFGEEAVVDVAQVKTLGETERETILEALARNHGRRKRTAEELKISERTLYRKIKQYNLIKNGDNE